MNQKCISLCLVFLLAILLIACNEKKIPEPKTGELHVLLDWPARGDNCPILNRLTTLNKIADIPPDTCPVFVFTIRDLKGVKYLGDISIDNVKYVNDSTFELTIKDIPMGKYHVSIIELTSEFIKSRGVEGSAYVVGPYFMNNKPELEGVVEVKPDLKIPDKIKILIDNSPSRIDREPLYKIIIPPDTVD